MEARPSSRGECVMAESDQGQDAVELLGGGDTGLVERPGFDRRAFLRRTAMTGVAAGSVSTLLAACGSSASSGGSSGSIFGSHPNYKFVFVNHVTTNPFFTPTQYGIADACKLLGCSYQWTGSENSNVSQMVNAVNTAVASKADGIAVALIDLHAFNE
ncbi:MAG TPA: substrate-binding domain-containing protein, partial [Solirubrobacteraceae bacterium]|nr:substrate-binding domain-containing protein [Solirubrobacteraceae bacterium]